MVHGSFAFWPCSGKVEALLKEQKICIGLVPLNFAQLVTFKNPNLAQIITSQHIHTYAVRLGGRPILAILKLGSGTS